MTTKRSFDKAAEGGSLECAGLMVSVEDGSGVFTGKEEARWVELSELGMFSEKRFRDWIYSHDYEPGTPPRNPGSRPAAGGTRPHFAAERHGEGV